MAKARLAPGWSPARLLASFTLLALGVTPLTGCPRRQVHLPRADGGSAVVLVDRAPGPPPDAGTALPTAEEREPNNTLAEAQALVPGQAMRGAMNASTTKRGDVDFYKLVLGPTGAAAGIDGAPAVGAPRLPPPPPRPPASQGAASQPAARPAVERSLVTAQLTGVPGLDLALDVLDERGELLLGANDGRAGAAESIPNLGLAAGTYYARIRQAGKPAPVEGTQPYTLTVTVSPLAPGEEIEPNDKAAWATELLPGTDMSGFYGSRRDADWFRVPLGAVPAGSTLRVDLQGVAGVSAVAAIHDSIQTKLAEARGGRGDRVALRSVAVKQGEPHVFVVVHAEAGRSHETRYALRVSVDLPGEPTEIEPNDDRARATPLEGTQGALAGYIAAPADADWFRLTATAAALARVEVTCPERVDLKLSVHSAAGTELWRVDEAGRREPEVLVNVPVPAGGAVFVRVAARPGDANPDEPYRLTWRLEPDDGGWEREPNNSLAAANLWPEGTRTVRGYVHPRGDIDTFRVVAPADRPSKVRVTVRPLPRVNVTLTLLETAELGASTKPAVVAESKPAGADAERTLEAPLVAGRTYYVQLRDGSGKVANPRDSYSITISVE